MRSFSVKENYISSAVSEILRNRQKNLLLYKIGLVATPLEAFKGTWWGGVEIDHSILYFRFKKKKKLGLMFFGWVLNFF